MVYVFSIQALTKCPFFKGRQHAIFFPELYSHIEKNSGEKFEHMLFVKIASKGTSLNTFWYVAIPSHHQISKIWPILLQLYVWMYDFWFWLLSSAGLAYLLQSNQEHEERGLWYSIRHAGCPDIYFT